jgi:hypothetical protein
MWQESVVACCLPLNAKLFYIYTLKPQKQAATAQNRYNSVSPDVVVN